MANNVLVVSPHADDAEFGCGATIAKLVTRFDYQVTILLVSCSGYGSVIRSVRMREQEAAAKVLGVKTKFLDLGDENQLQLAAPDGMTLVLQQQFVKGFKKLFVPLPGFNQDHKAVYDACIAALRPTNDAMSGGTVYAYEYPGETWGGAAPHTGLVYSPVARAQLDQKLEALACYKTQTASQERGLWGREGVEQLAKWRGLECGVPYAELFYLLRGMM